MTLDHVTGGAVTSFWGDLVAGESGLLHFSSHLAEGAWPQAWQHDAIVTDGTLQQSNNILKVIYHPLYGTNNYVLI